jgi:3-methyladenine DNA glycosylase/8-oxoguanine DNA glycosylase
LTRELGVRPRGPYSLALSARLSSDATRRFHDGVLTALVDGAVVRAWQSPDGTVWLRGPQPSLERLRWILALDDDHSEFLLAVRDDPLLGRAARDLGGLRPVRVPTVAQAVLRALCGQLIESHRARLLERRIVQAVSPRRPDGLCPAPSRETLARWSPAELRRLGLHARRAAALVRIVRELDLERLHEVSTEAAAARLERERGLGPWSVGVVCLQGLGRTERGLVGDLGLVKLVSGWRGRWVETEETADLLAPYGRWAGLASVYLLAGSARNLVPGAEPPPRRRPLAA